MVVHPFLWMGDWGCLMWSDIPNNRVLRWTEENGAVSTFQSDSGYSNGHSRDTQGRLLAMEHDTRRVRRPKGICFSPDFKKCYVVDTGATDGPGNPANIIVFDVKDQKLSNPKIFADFAPGFTDGVRCDTDGNVWCGWGWGGMETNGVRFHHPDGTKRNRLFMTGSTSIYALYVNAQGHALS